VSVDNHHGIVLPRHRTARFHRAHLHEALQAHVPPSTIELRKAFKSVKLDEASDNLLLSFEDGSTARADLLLGTDGIRSAVRRQFVPDSNPKWTGWVAFRTVYDINRLKGLGDVLDEANHWWGPNRSFFSSPLGKGLFTIVGSHYSDPDAPDTPYKDATWNSEGNVDDLRPLYKDWHPAIRKMIDVAPNVRRYPNTFAPALPSWSFLGGRVTLAGDAAHAHGGAFAAGGSSAIDDAYALSAAIWHVFPPGTSYFPSQSIAQALSLYENVRRPHTTKVVALVQGGNKAVVARLQKEESEEEVLARLKNRSDPYWIHEHDVVKIFTEAVAQLERNNSRL